ncbi:MULTISPECIES: PadR family transcriptional regulator [unclassified Saccharopolyspora]|uniref:PadR family transcriptional regulator n=1 Tax=unclassified Saccharopolyspora TaxID=2646250 RepID=UPI001CD52B6A|nr:MULTISPECIES: PadR family transcriptional regulator [unclassified Saccharopolyspora]MCA1194303.1 PadR family transcriptional regulator [Saccharopolyspora sp. 6V]MCA1224734.1 PadR family transcriptional regulator [Saccharopolyspora sp. 6M]MCA1279339.1 PadR family transcriptional regulator [Saccharopolyspora sp. 7B]
MWIDVLLLAHLAKEPSHGYELRKRVEEGTGFALSNNSLYPALRRFTEAAAVTRSAEPQVGRPPRNVYTITEVGRELLHDMLAELPAELAADEPEFLARLAHFDWLTADERLGVVESRRCALRQRRDRLSALTRNGASAWGQEALDESLRRLRAELDWLDGIAARATADSPPQEEHP